jgi:hypothetical protein
LRIALRVFVSVLGFFLGLYLADTLLAPYFYISQLWMAILLAIVMGAANSTNRPFRGFKANKGRAFGFFGLTALANYLILQITALIFDSLSGNPIAIMFTAVFLTLLAALLNHVVGFKPVEQPKVITREHGLTDSTRERMAQTDARSRKKSRRRKRS